MDRVGRRLWVFALFARFALAALVGGCAYEPTQITIVVDSDLRGRWRAARVAVPCGP